MRIDTMQISIDVLSSPESLKLNLHYATAVAADTTITPISTMTITTTAIVTDTNMKTTTNITTNQGM